MHAAQLILTAGAAPSAEAALLAWLHARWKTSLQHEGPNFEVLFEIRDQDLENHEAS
jgi:hypothetical protein